MRASFVGGAALVLCLVGCDLQRGSYRFEVQPDGSGRVEVEGALPPPIIRTQPRSPGEGATWLAQVDGIAAWTDVVATVDSDDWVRVKGTGWFRSLAEVTHLRVPLVEVAALGSEVDVRCRDFMLDGVDGHARKDAKELHKALHQPDDVFEGDARRAQGLALALYAHFRQDLTVRVPGAELLERDGFVAEGTDGVGLHHDHATVMARVTDVHLAELRDLRARVRRGELTPEQAAARWTTKPAPRVLRARWRAASSEADPAFKAAFEAALEVWRGSEWKRRLDALRPRRRVG